MTKRLRVTCNCNGLRMSGTYEIKGDWLYLHSPLGTCRARLGIANPRKLAGKLMKNLSAKAAARMPTHVSQTQNTPSISVKAQELVDNQRDRLATMAADDPERPKEERVLDQMVENSRAIDTAAVLLDPQASEANDEANSSASPASETPS